MSSNRIRFSEVVPDRDPELFQDLVELYLQTFTERSEREDPSAWLPRIAAAAADGRPRTFIVLAVDEDPTRGTGLAGGVVFEYFHGSHTALVSYLVVHPAYRRGGVGRGLAERALAILRNVAETNGKTLRAVFAEVQDPRKIAEGGESFAPELRLEIFEAWGVRRVGIPYVQPELAEGEERPRHLMLLVVYPAGTDTIPAADVRDFLMEFYTSLGVRDPASDPDMVLMLGGLTNPVRLLPLRDKIIPT